MPTDIYRETIRRIEIYWHANNRVPTQSLLAQEMNLSEEEIDDIFAHPDFVRLLQKSYYWEAYQRSDSDLTSQQLLTLNVLANQYDKRSHTQKFRDLKITPQQFNRWMQEPAFSRALNERIQKNFHDDGWKVLQSILQTASSGDTNAAKFYMELTGRYTPTNRTQSVNVSLKAVDLLVEVLTRHLGALPNGAALLDAIGADFQRVLSGEAPATISPVLKTDLLDEYQQPQFELPTKQQKSLDFLETIQQLDILEDF
jgi:hypothetical protein